MDSEADSSILSPSITSDSVETGSTRGRLAYTTWAHTRPARNREREYSENAHIKYCIYCTELPLYGTLVTTNMRNYFKLKY